MTIGDTIKSKETGIVAKIINFSPSDVLVDVIALPDRYCGSVKIGATISIRRHHNDRWKLNWKLDLGVANRMAAETLTARS